MDVSGMKLMDVPENQDQYPRPSKKGKATALLQWALSEFSNWIGEPSLFQYLLKILNEIPVLERSLPAPNFPWYRIRKEAADVSFGSVKGTD